jgi:hypothetical protein
LRQWKNLSPTTPLMIIKEEQDLQRRYGLLRGAHGVRDGEYRPDAHPDMRSSTPDPWRGAVGGGAIPEGIRIAWAGGVASRFASGTRRGLTRAEAVAEIRKRTTDPYELSEAAAVTRDVLVDAGARGRLR